MITVIQVFTCKYRGYDFKAFRSDWTSSQKRVTILRESQTNQKLRN